MTFRDRWINIKMEFAQHFLKQDLSINFRTNVTVHPYRLWHDVKHQNLYNAVRREVERGT